MWEVTEIFFSPAPEPTFGGPVCVRLKAVPFYFPGVKTYQNYSQLFYLLAKTGHGPHSPKLLCCSMYCLFCVVLCIVCV
jgi:hypothetical protein